MIEVEVEMAYEISALRRILAYYDTGVVQAYDFKDGELTRANTKYDFAMPLSQQAYSVWEGKHWMGSSGTEILELDREGNQLGSHTLPSDIGTIFGLDHHEDELIVFGGDKVYRFDDDFNEIADYNYDSDTPIVRSGCVVRWTYFYVPYHPDRTIYAYDTDMNRVSSRDWVYTNVGNVRGSEYVDGYVILLHRKRSGGQNLSTLAVYRYDDLNFDGSTINVPLQTIEITGVYGHALAAEKHFVLSEPEMAYGVRKLVESEVEMAYAIQQFGAMLLTEFEFELAYGVRKLIESEPEMAYGIRKLIEMENTMAYGVRKIIEGSEKTMAYGIRKLIETESTFAYAIQQIAQMMPLTEFEFEMAYGVRKLIETEATFAYSIQQFLQMIFTEFEFELAYGVRKLIETEKEMAYGVRQIISMRIRRMAYGVRNLVTSEPEMAYGVRKLISSESTFAYGIRKLLEVERTLAYGVRKVIEVEKTLAYGIRKFISIEHEMAYSINSIGVLIYGSVGEQFMTDLIAVLNDDARWGSGFSNKPSIDRVYDRKVLSFGKQSEEAISVFSDTETIRPFSLGLGRSAKAWRHDVTATIRIVTNVSRKRYQDLISIVVDIIKQNVVSDGYVQLQPTGVHNTSDETRNEWSGVVDVDAMAVAKSSEVS